MKVLQALLFLLMSIPLFSQNIVEFRGINRSGHYNAEGLLKQWPESGPELLLQIEGVGKGYSQPIFADGKIFISGIKKDTSDILSAYNLKGEMLWETPYGRSWTGSYIDSRSTPTYEEGKLYIVSGTGQINCIDAETGQTVWQIHAIKTYNGELFKYGESECLLLTETAVLYTTGGSQNTMVALNKKDGSLLWKAKSEGGPKAYASPTLINHNGRDIILTLTAKNIIGINPYNGEVLWSYDVMQYHKPTHGYGENTNPPLYNDGQVFITSGYNHPGVMLSLSEDGNEVQLKWMNEDFDTHHGGNLFLDGYIYGSNFQNNSNGKWMCANWKNGHTNWESEWETKGSIITANGMLYLYEEKRGNVALVEPSPEGLKVISTFQITSGDGPHWAHPAIYHGKLFIRHGDVLMVYDLTNEI